MILLFSNCKKKCDEYLLGDLIYSNPLTGNETIVFYGTNEENIIFKGQGRRNYMNKSNENNQCRIVELDDCYFDEENKKYELLIHLSPTTDYQPAYLVLFFYDYTYNKFRHYTSKKSIFEIPLSKENLKPGQLYFDSLLVINQYYSDVFAGETDLDLVKSTKDTIHPSMFYYATSHGIIKIDFDDGSSWELKEIIP